MSRPKRSLGQNFLVDRGIAERIVEAVSIRTGNTILEIGPGRGALTEGLVARVQSEGARLVLVELDDDLAASLGDRFAANASVDVIHRDIMDLAMSEVESRPDRLSVVGNIPYNITTPIVFHLLTRPRPSDIVLMVQREVADRILAPPGGGTYGALSVGVRSVAEVERLLNVPAGAFRPSPRVDSTVIRIRPIRPEPLAPEEEARLRCVTRAVFQWRRKQLGKTLRDHPDLSWSADRISRALVAAGAERRDRPETLDPAAFVALVRTALD